MTKTTNNAAIPGVETSAERGKRHYRDGYSFEEKTAELYRLLKFSVEHGRIFAGRQVDLFLTGRWGDLPILRAIECKSGEVQTRDIDEFLIKLSLVRKEFPSASGTIVSGVSFTDAVTSHAAAIGITLVLYRDLAATLIDGHRYVTGLIKELEGNDTYELDTFVEQRIGREIDGADMQATKAIDEWLDDGESRQLTLLGDLGTGKSFLMRVISHKLATKFLKDPQKRPFPVFIDLREADREVSREGIIVTHFARSGIEGVSFNLFQHCLAEGNIVLILDGFDEMAAKVTPNVTARNFNELMRCVKGRAKVLLTCRTHYFRDRTEEEELILGAAKALESESAKDLYWDLVGRPGFSIAYLRPFGISEITMYVRRVRPGDYDNVLERIRNTYDLMELSTRPLLLDMIVKTINRLTAQRINAATIYEAFTNVWVTRDQWRDVITAQEKQTFLTTIAMRFWQTSKINFHFSELEVHVDREFSRRFQDSRDLTVIDHEMRTASFLTRDSKGYYGFAHKSYAEFFLAKYLAGQIRQGKCDCLKEGRLTPEIISFVRDLLEDFGGEGQLEEILKGEYTPYVSENALLLLYNFRLQKARREQVDLLKTRIVLPDGVNLPSAHLDQVNIERCTLRKANLIGADFSQSILLEVDFTDSNLSGARLDKAELQRAKFANTLLTDASLQGANCSGIDFSGANLEGANLMYLDLSTAVVTDARLDRALMSNVILSDELAERVGGKTELERLQGKVLREKVETNNPKWRAVLEISKELLTIAKRYEWLYGCNAEDLVSDVLVRMVEAREGRNIEEWDQKKLIAYAHRLTVDLVRDQYMASRRQIATHDFDEFASEKDGNHLSELVEMFGTGPRPEDPAEQTYLAEIISLAEARLPPQYLQIFFGLIEGQLPSDIARDQGLSMNQLRRAIERVRNVVGDIVSPSADHEP